MLIHLVPKMFFKYSNRISIESLEIPKLNLFLSSNDLVARKPFPNKQYYVACRRQGKKAIKGILIETNTHLDEFQVITKWAIEGENTVEHVVNYKIIDKDFTMMSDDFILMYASDSDVLGHFSSRWNTENEDFSPASGQPYMEFVDSIKKGEQFEGRVVDTLVFLNKIAKREEFISLPTIEVERFIQRGNRDERFPSIDDKFIAKKLDINE